MNNTNPTLVDLDGWLVVRYPCAMLSEPKICVNYWPTGIRTSDFKRDYGYELPMLLRTSGIGIGSYTLDNGATSTFGRFITIRLTDGGQTKSIKYETINIPCPKVKAGIETRWHNGYWQKYLKSKGWVAA